MDRWPAWEEVSDDFEPDGSLRDVYAFDTSLNEWQRFLDALRASPYPFRYEVEGIEEPLPDSASEIFATRNQATTLKIVVGPLQIDTHFFVEEEMEFDLDPREVAEGFEECLSFIRWLGDTVRKTVTITAENSPELVILRYEQKTGAMEHVRG